MYGRDKDVCAKSFLAPPTRISEMYNNYFEILTLLRTCT